VPDPRRATVTISISSPLRAFCGGDDEMTLTAATLGDALVEIQRVRPELHRAVCDETGRVRRHVNVYVNDLHMAERDGLRTALADGDVITLLPAVSGG
jgi:molybdopterin synthase sulfur carrier subunit